jgi:hypothetical protein
MFEEMTRGAESGAGKACGKKCFPGHGVSGEKASDLTLTIPGARLDHSRFDG